MCFGDQKVAALSTAAVCCNRLYVAQHNGCLHSTSVVVQRATLGGCQSKPSGLAGTLGARKCRRTTFTAGRSQTPSFPNNGAPSF
jgi:hypothetical protein